MTVIAPNVLSAVGWRLSAHTRVFHRLGLDGKWFRVRDFRQLRIWHQAQDLAAQIYPLTESFPTPERYGLTSQIRRAATSVPANIAEGAGRSSNREMLFHLGVAAGSLSELDSHIDLAAQLGFLEVQEALRVRESVRMLRRSIYRFRSSLVPPTDDKRRAGRLPRADS